MDGEGIHFSQEISDKSAGSPENKRYIRVRGGKMTTEDAKAYLAKREVPQLFECLMTGLMYHRPKDHITYLRECLDKIRSKGLDHVRWNLFVEQRRKTPLPPISPQNGSRPQSAQSYYSRGSSKADLRSQEPLPPIGTIMKGQTDGEAIKIGDTVIPNVPFVFFMGGPGSGKGTQCKRLVERYTNWVHLSMGDLLRQQVSEQGSSDAKWGMISDLLVKGDMAPEDVTIDLITDNLKKHPNAGGFIIEGYPRTMDQLKEYQTQVGKVDLVFLLDCEEYFLQSRLVARGKQEGRIDDNLAAVASKINFFKENTLPVVKSLDDEGKLVLVDGDRDTEEICFELARAFDSIFFNTGDGKPILPTAPTLDGPPIPRPPSGRKSPGSRHSSRASSAGSQASFAAITHIDDIVLECADDGRKLDLPQCPIILIMGGPGSGKLTQCKRLVERYEGIVHLSMGDILRSEIVAKGTGEDKWNLVGNLVQKGEMAPEEVTADLLLSSIRQHADAKAILLEGFPRDGKQVDEINRHVGGISLAVLIDCEEYYLKLRLINRQRESDRIDDNLNAIASRITFFKNCTLPVVKHYDEDGKLVIINGDRDADEVFFDMASLFDHMFFGAPLENGSVEGAPVEDAIVAEEAEETGGGGGNPDYAEHLEQQDDTNNTGNKETNTPNAELTLDEANDRNTVSSTEVRVEVPTNEADVEAVATVMEADTIPESGNDVSKGDETAEKEPEAAPEVATETGEKTAEVVAETLAEAVEIVTETDKGETEAAKSGDSEAAKDAAPADSGVQEVGDAADEEKTEADVSAENGEVMETTEVVEAGNKGSDEQNGSVAEAEILENNDATTVNKAAEEKTIENDQIPETTEKVESAEAVATELDEAEAEAKPTLKEDGDEEPTPQQTQQDYSSPPRPASDASHKSGEKSSRGGSKRGSVSSEKGSLQASQHSSPKGSKPGSPQSKADSPKPQSRESSAGSNHGSPKPQSRESSAGSKHGSPKPQSRESSAGSKHGSPKPHSRESSAGSKHGSQKSGSGGKE
ncbi:adenylate kinase isoenzyme 5-like isoform X2 [Lineus longissimus]|uniref:adenylate kinase isoenzyme 5-like isoform X2 n=1 Tax=Lineus longissimus TaxID=88925 RepID=UPI00315CC6A3